MFLMLQFLVFAYLLLLLTQLRLIGTLFNSLCKTLKGITPCCSFGNLRAGFCECVLSYYPII